MKDWLKAREPLLVSQCRYAREDDYRAGIERVLGDDGWAGERWLFKTSPFYLPFFRAFDPCVVKVRRNRGSVVESNITTRMVAKGQRSVVERIVDGHIAALDALPGADVDTDAVVSGDDTTLRAAVESAGLDYDPAITRAFVNPEYWRH